MVKPLFSVGENRKNVTETLNFEGSEWKSSNVILNQT